MMDLTPVCNAFIALLAAIITAFFIPWLKSRTSAQDREAMLVWVDIAVAAAEQLYHNLNGAERKAYVLDFLAGKGYRINDQALGSAIEAAVLRLHKSLEGRSDG